MGKKHDNKKSLDSFEITTESLINIKNKMKFIKESIIEFEISGEDDVDNREILEEIDNLFSEIKNKFDKLTY